MGGGIGFRKYLQRDLLGMSLPQNANEWLSSAGPEVKCWRSEYKLLHCWDLSVLLHKVG